MEAIVGTSPGDEAASVPAPHTPTAENAAKDARRVREEGITRRTVRRSAMFLASGGGGGRLGHRECLAHGKVHHEPELPPPPPPPTLPPEKPPPPELPDELGAVWLRLNDPPLV